MRYASLSKKPKHFRNFTGLSVKEFNTIVSDNRADWERQRARNFKKKRQRNIGGGRKLLLPNLEDRVLVFAVYARLYTSHILLEYLFGVDESTICRMIHEMSALLSTQIVIDPTRKKITTLEELREAIPDLDEVILDATEQIIPKPEDDDARKLYKSGKVKKHTLKTQMVTTRTGLILHASDVSPGSVHDYKYFKQSDIPGWLSDNPDIRAYADKGYQGANKDFPRASVVLPTRRTRTKRELTACEQKTNGFLSSKRLPIEHTFGRLKQYRLLGGVYRNKKERYSAFFKSIAYFANTALLERQRA